MRVKLTVKLAEVVEGIDVSAWSEGEVIELPDRDANLLILGGWAERVPHEERISSAATPQSAIAADGGSSKSKNPKRKRRV